MKKKQILMVIVLLLLITTLVGLYAYRNQGTDLSKECPDEWIEDRMPSIENENNATERQYFIFNGERKEIKDYDVDWIKNNCSVEIQYAY